RSARGGAEDDVVDDLGAPAQILNGEALVDTVKAFHVVGGEQARQQSVGRDAALAEKARVGAADRDRRRHDGLRRMRPAGLLDVLEELAVPGRGRVGRVRPAHFERNVRIVYDLLEVRNV